jgi:rhodanese-related sulfurtransferase
VLDVREAGEFAAGHIEGSVNVPYHDLRGVPDGLDSALPIAAICSSGQRSAMAASLLLRSGAARPLHVADGGVGTWSGLGRPVVAGAVTA